MPRLILFIFCIAFLLAAGGWFKTGVVLFAMDFGLLLIWVGWVMLRGLLDYPAYPRPARQADCGDLDQPPGE